MPAYLLRLFILRLWLIIIMITGYISCLSPPGVQAAVAEGKDNRYYDPVEVPGEMLPSLEGKKLASLAGFSWQDTQWQQALIQIDERTPAGRFILTEGPEANPAEGNGILDPQDIIVFMARHAGGQAPPASLPPGADTLTPVEIIDPITTHSRWLYLAAFPDQAPQTSLAPLCEISQDKDQFILHFPTYDYNALINHHKKESTPTIYINKLSVNQAAGGNGKNIIDRQKVRGKLSFLGGLLKISFDEGILSGGITAYKPGPIRVLTHSVMFPQLPLKIKGPKFYIDSILVDTLTLTATEIRIPFDPGYLIHELVLELGFDLTPEAKGMRFYNSVNPQGFLINGEMDNSEKHFNTTKDDWRLITGPQGTQIALSDIDPMMVKKGSIQTQYTDNEKKEAPPENYSGEIGTAVDRITIKGIKAGVYRINVLGCIPHHFYLPGRLNEDLLDDILSIRNRPLKIKVGQKVTENLGGTPRVLASGFEQE